METPLGGMSSCKILLFGDLSAPFEEDLQSLLHVRDNPLLSSFFEQTGARIRSEIGGLGTNRQSLFPRFTTLIDLVAKLGETEGTPVLKFCLLCICQVGQFLNYYGQEGRQYPSPQDTYALGICAGSFAAAAVGSSRSLSELVPVATEAVVVAFRTALVSYITKSNIVGDGEEQGESWSVLTSGQEKEIEEKIKEFTTSEDVQGSWKPYISATTQGHVTLSGPPETLKRLISDQQLKSYELAIESPYHAAHLFDDAVVEEVLSHPDPTSRPFLPILSPWSGDLVTAQDFKETFTAIVKGCLIERVQWDAVLSGVVERLEQNDFQRCKVLHFNSNACQLLSAALSRADIEVHIEKAYSASRRSSTQHGHFADSKIAIIGYSGRFPDSASNDQFWELLRAGKDVHREVPPDRFNWRTHYDPTGKTKNTSRVKYGCWIKEPGLFDARFFNISPREAENTDPAQRLAITTVYEAMEMAGMVPNRTPSTQQDRIGCFFGTTSDDWREVNSGQDVDTYFIPGGNRAFVPGRISYFFRFSGPSLSMDTACSSSFAAIQTACAYLWRGEVDTAVAGGTNVLTNPDNFVGLDRGHFLSTTGNCNAFDDEASGYCRADAVGSVILKRLEDAEMDNDPIFGIISGATTNHCGQTDSITRPHEGDQTSVFKRIVRHAGVNPLDVSYVEMHGTGTQAGDATEMNSVLSVFVPSRDRMPRYPLYLGSAKANIGHAESASGVSSLIKVLMMMKHSEIPPHCGIKGRINHNYPLDLKERNVNIALTPTPWLRDQSPCGKRLAFLNNFSAAGGNTAVLLEDAPIPKTREHDPRSFHLVAVSSKTANSLKGNIEALVKHLDKNPDIPASWLSYTSTARRMQFSYRTVAIGTDSASIAEALRSKLSTIEPKTIPPASRLPKIVFVFTGQGSFYTGLGKDLFTHVSSFREDMVRFERIAVKQGLPGFLDVVEVPDSTGADDPIVTQLVIACLQMALTQLWRSWGIKPSTVVGHSLGEYAALFAAGVLSASDTIYLVGARAKLLTHHCKPGTHSMLAIKASSGSVSSLINNSAAEVACLNQPTGVVISATIDEIERLSAVFKENKLNTTRLDVPFAFHSSQVDPILEDFEKVLHAVQFKPASIPIISPLHAEVISNGGVLAVEYLAKACRQKVNFQGALEEASSAGIVDEKTIWLEVGSHPACSGMIKGTLGSDSHTASTLRKDTDTWKVLTTTLEMLYLKGIDINWNEFHRDFEQYNRVVDLPQYRWDSKNYWIMYKNDFCLTKGEGAQHVLPSTIETPKPSKFISHSLQRVIEEDHGSASSAMLVESDVHDPELMPIFTGHRVNGAELCPSSLWADIAMHITTCMMEQRSLPLGSTGLDVHRMQISKPLVLNRDVSSQLFRVKANADWSDSSIKISIFSVNEQATMIADHATCTVRLVPCQTWVNEWKRISYLIRGRIEALRRAVEGGDAHRMKRSIVYRLFANIVEYSPPYQGMSEVVLDSNDLEAVSTVQFQVNEKGFYFNPQWIDSLGGIAGFIMNGNGSPHAQAEVFINHGWDGFKMIEKLEHGKTYHCYNRMQLVEGTLYAGDTYILDGDRIVGIVQQVKFMGVPRRALDTLRLNGKTRSTNPMAAPSPPRKAIPRTQVTSPTVYGGDHLTVPTTKPSLSDDKWLGIAAIISEEVGVELRELKPETEFAELGLDSLLSLTIIGRMCEELHLDLPSTTFVEYPTVKELQQRYGGKALSSIPTVTANSINGEKSGTSTLGTSTPNTSLASEPESLNYLCVFRSIISEETGIKTGDLTPSTRLDEIGVDSLLGLTTIGRLSEAYEMEISSTLFAENETLFDVEKALASTLGIQPSPSLPASTTTNLEDTSLGNSVVQNSPLATSILLQGSPNAAKSTVFMFPDGSGSASSYATLARMDSTVTVYGLNCPWRTTPEGMTESKCTLNQLSAKYIIEIRRRQPKGPYNLGGWSAGGICAFEAARQLVTAGEAVDNLILIDSPNPIGLQNPPARMYDFFQQLGIFGGGGKIPKWLRAHFDAFIRMLDDYEPIPWPQSAGRAPKTLMLYASDGVCKDPNGPRPEIRPDDPREMIWLLNDRTDFSADGWASLLGRECLTVEVLEGVHHFSMMDPGPQMDAMSACMKKTLLVKS